MLRFLVKTTFRSVAASYNTPERKGARGERRVNRALLTGLNKNEYRILSDLIVPVGGVTSQVDHVVVSRYGIFVIETKNMSGWIFGSGDQKTWTQVFKGGKKQSFQNPLHQNYGHVKAVQAALDIDEATVHNLVAFVGDAIPKTPMPDRVAWGMRELSAQIAQRRQFLYSEEQVQTFVRTLNEIAPESTKDLKRQHVQNIERLAAKRKAKQLALKTAVIEDVLCPKCKAEMVERKNRKTGERFWGCTKFPKYRGSLPGT